MTRYILNLDHEINDCRYCPCVRFIHPTDSDIGDCVCFAIYDNCKGDNVIASNVSEVDMLDTTKSRKIKKPNWCPMRLVEG